MLLQLIVVSHLLLHGVSSTESGRRIVDLVVNRAIMKHERNDMLLIFTEKLPIQTHTTSETNCEDIVKELTMRGEDDYLVLIGIEESNCPKAICKKNFANILLPAGSLNKTVTYGCDPEQFPIDWKAISENIHKRQDKNMFAEIPKDYQEERSFLTENRGVVAGIAVMGLVIIGLVLLLILTSLKHGKEVKTLKKGAGLNENKKKNDENITTADSTK